MGRFGDTAERVVIPASVAVSGGPAPWRQARALLAKDLRAELRTRVAVSAIGVFTLSALMLLGLATERLKDAQAVRAAVTYGLLDRASVPLTRADIQPAWDAVGKMGILW